MSIIDSPTPPAAPKNARVHKMADGEMDDGTGRLTDIRKHKPTFRPLCAPQVFVDESGGCRIIHTGGRTVSALGPREVSAILRAFERK